MPGAAGPRVLAYSHDGFGLGHLRRNVRLLAGLRARRPDVDTLIVTGAKAAERVVSPYGLDWLRLPAVVKVANGQYESDEPVDSAFDPMSYRIEVLTDAVRTFRPDLLLVDRYPEGMRGELAPALDALRTAAPGARLVLGLRDILDEPAAVLDEWERSGHSDVIRDRYQAVLVYGDRRIFDPVREYRIPDDVAAKIRFTGYLADDIECPSQARVRAELASEGRRLVVCTLGGGRDAYPVAEAFLAAATRLVSDGWDSVLITGPYMIFDDVARLLSEPSRPGIRIVDMVQDLPSHLAAADAVVCMGGYNTMCEVLATSTPAVVVPRVSPRREQQMRCERFESLGLTTTMLPGDLDAARLAAEISRVAGQGRRNPPQNLALDGIRGAAAILDDLLPVTVRP